MATSSLIKSDLYSIHYIVQNTMLSHAKAIFVETLREGFSRETYYHYVRDSFGFPKILDHTDLPSDAGIRDDEVSRIFIGESYRTDMKHIPAILIKGGSFKYVPISLSRNEGLIQYSTTRVVDGYGNETLISTPSHFILAGAWEGQINIDVLAGDIKGRDYIVEIIGALIEIVYFKEFQKSGVVVKPINIGAPSEKEDLNGKIYAQTISCDVRTEWRQHIPINTIIDTISFCMDFGDISVNPPVIAPNISVSTEIDILDDI